MDRDQEFSRIVQVSYTAGELVDLIQLSSDMDEEDEEDEDEDEYVGLS